VTYFMTYFELRLAGLQFTHRVLNVVPAHDCVPLKDAASAPSTDFHDDRFSRFSDSGTAEIPRGREGMYPGQSARFLAKIAGPAWKTRGRGGPPGGMPLPDKAFLRLRDRRSSGNCNQYAQVRARAMHGERFPRNSCGLSFVKLGHRVNV
jgi:hypothetical protein